ncbi:MAG: carbamoyl phosphate synthase large subunit [Treponema sp. GWB1_62_6]|nr:MAG: carbamoyl phosphate synthase large subunit [Treponema sp. GWB1_62_6]OHE67331.1 MAG: carbamoyl phosphate synthase large subunit [Treponema sp. GWA1_62_8]OHE67466.1 MAG: carbamoyl phosphate synthase large subunit [Treponema sp. GWC1_61_84]OHE76024.1 MAG: carbamoyl phosphate synthase large subunit [Treponema sp. RIFOXYC1_FULL_61_9]HCM27456.1 carbamoyl phosphate synthase large subunit [Treponema sp.]
MPKKVLVLGSGGLKIGQAGEFDYSGTQALKALREEGIKTVLINPNIATIQTSEGMADATYFLPVTPEFVRQVIEKEKPDGILLSFGGQTALNCGVALDRDGTLYKHSVAVLGTPVKAIEETEDRELFVRKLEEIGAKSPRSIATTDADAAAEAAAMLGYPVMVRVAYALGGSGSGICKNEGELRRRCDRAFAHSPQVLVEEWLGGWKEIEYEVVRDRFGNCVTVCNMENFDPLGIHTGESIVVAPSQTLTDAEYHKLRRVALDVIRHLGIVGECNIQYALDPHSEDYRIIEVNARLSRSSALASKATGYPLAFVAAKLALGYSLTDIENRITRVTKSCFEPALDYCVVKVPRWDLTKFKNVERRIGSEMKSVGEVMSIGRTFEEALQKALRMTGIGAPGLSGDEALLGLGFKDLKEALTRPTDRRVFAVYRALAEGWSVDKIHKFTRIDRWFLSKMANALEAEKALRALASASPDPTALPDRELLLKAKRLGFSDERIGQFLGVKEERIRALREEYRIRPAVKQIDTLAAEYPARTNYLYMTYGAVSDDTAPSNRGVMVLGSGAYRIGSSVEFDWCCVNAVETARKLGRHTIMVNCNPETVSTDYDMCDRLYFEELSLERVLDIYERERPDGLILSMGGQIPNNLATKLYDAGAVIFGTTPKSIDMAEDRHKFSKLLDELGIEQPDWKELTDLDAAEKFAKEVGYPVLIRPSYVLSGAAMNVAWNNESLERFLLMATDVSPEHPVVISKFVENSKEIEVDAVAKRGVILYHAITEHIENAGIHSGDATVVLPPQRLYIETIRKIRKIAERIAEELDITGPFNIQFLAQRNRVRVIECNLRASRSFPFCSKVSRVNMIEMATRAMLDEPVQKAPASALDLEWVGVKAAQFSFSRLHGADPVPGVEMASTGEVGCIGTDLDDAFLKALLSVGYRIPRKKVLLSTGPIEDKVEFLDSARKLTEMGYELYASRGTARFLASNGVAATALNWPLESKEPNIAGMIKRREIDMVINVPKNNRETELKNDYIIRRMAVDYDVPLFTNIKVAKQFTEALSYKREKELEIKAWEEYR